MSDQLRDGLFKLFWTMANAGLTAAIVWAGDLSYWWAAPLLAGLQFASTWVRQKVAERASEPFDWTEGDPEPS